MRDCISCIDVLATDKKVKNQIVNIGPGDENYITVNNLFEMISNKLNFNQKPKYYPDRPNEVKHSSCSAEKAEKLLGYKTKYTVSDSLDTIINYIKKRGVREFQYTYDIEILNDKTPITWKNKLF